LAREDPAGRHELVRDRLRDRITERGADLRRASDRAVQLRARLGRLATGPAEERDPEVHVTEDPWIGALLAGGECPLEPGDGRGGAGRRPPGTGATERGPQTELGPRIVRPQARLGAVEEREGFAVREAFERVLAGDHEVLGGGRRVTRTFEVQPDHGCELPPAFRVERKQRVGRESVQSPTVLL